MISFGPVPSRRLGKSLGINNIVSPKVCSYGCIYCQVGQTLRKSINRETFFKPEFIYQETAEHIERVSKDDFPDYITVVSNGEPTLDINLGKTITLLKTLGIPVAVISNASLIEQESVKEDLFMADWVSLKMDAPDDDTWRKINRPAPGLDYYRILEHIYLFARSCKGALRTETMVVAGLNDSEDKFSALAESIKKINPGIAYLSVPTRPPAERTVSPPDADKLNLGWQIFTDMRIKTEFLTGFEGTATGHTGNIYEDILNITAVHPLREDSLAELLKKDNADFEVIRSLIKQRLLKTSNYKGHRYYVREYHLNH
ncbi:MAG TPA: radical SAM protein [Bacteroidales bacterium]|nr:radical SAM protein [Bacteroidales bacterium]